jgi:hypothetical protein
MSVFWKSQEYFFWKINLFLLENIVTRREQLRSRRAPKQHLSDFRMMTTTGSMGDES